MASEDKSYFARRAAEEAELAMKAEDPSAAAAHRRLQRNYTERASARPASRPPGNASNPRD